MPPAAADAASVRPRDPGAVRIAVLGAGRMGLTHLRNLAGIANARVVVVADPDGDAAERGRRLVGAERVELDPLAAVHAEDVEALVVVTPTGTHAAIIEAAIEARRAVWCEKPVSLDFADTLRVVERWRGTGVPVQLGYMRRFDPGYVRARELIASGALGRIETFRASSRNTTVPPIEFLRTFGGNFLDMAVHDLDLARFLVGEVDEVHAWAAVLHDQRFAEVGDWDTSVALLRFRDGALGTVETALHSEWGYDIRTEVAGSIGKVVVDAERRSPATHVRALANETDRYLDFHDRFADAYRRELEAFLEDLAAGRMPSPGPEDALETQRLAVAATRSWREGRPVEVASVT